MKEIISIPSSDMFLAANDSNEYSKSSKSEKLNIMYEEAKSLRKQGIFKNININEIKKDYQNAQIYSDLHEAIKNIEVKGGILLVSPDIWESSCGKEYIITTKEPTVVMGSNDPKNPTIIGNYKSEFGLGLGIFGRCENTCIDGFQVRGGSGIFLKYSSNNIIANNIARNNIRGFFLNGSSHNTLIGNIANSNKGTGILLDLFSENNNLINNIAKNNKKKGIYIDRNSTCNELISNIAKNNEEDGIYLLSSSDNSLTKNIANNNKGAGIVLDGSPYNFLMNNTSNGNNEEGILLHFSSNNTLIDNWAMNNNYGIKLGSFSSNNTLKSNSTGFSRICDIYNEEPNCKNNKGWKNTRNTDYKWSDMGEFEDLDTEFYFFQPLKILNDTAL